MTTAEALALIRSSAPYVNANGVLDMAWTRWALANEGEASKLEKFVAGESGPPELATKWGRGWVSLIGNGAPTPQPAQKLLLGAIVVNAGNCDPTLLRTAGVTHVAAEISAANLTDLATSRWNGFALGGFVVVRSVSDAQLAVQIAKAHGFSFVVADVEKFKLDQYPASAWQAWRDITRATFKALREGLGARTVYAVTYGVHSSTTVICQDLMREFAITYMPEAYGGDGRTLGVRRTVEKVVSEGWERPHVAVGDESLEADAAEILREHLALGGVWVWAPEQAGDSVLALRGLA